MSRSPYATTSALPNGCDTCEAWPNSPCVSMSTDGRDRGKPLKRCHSARRRAADAQRTQEVNPEVMKP
jgi:hypothetical protein